MLYGAESPAVAASAPASGSSQPVHRLFEAQVALRADALAVSAPDHELTYGRLDHLANQLAHRLRALGVGRETTVALCLERSAALIVGALGILKAGGAYVALDPVNPAERLALMVRDCGAAAIVTRSGIVDRLGPMDAAVLLLDSTWSTLDGQPRAALDVDSALNDLAYVIYTSGSTGRPKAVMVEHHSLVNLLSWHCRSFALTHSDRGTQIASPGFDAAVWEMWPLLTSGASVHIPDEALRTDPLALRDWLVAERITITFLPTAVAEIVVNLDWPADADLRYVLTGGDVLNRRPRPGLSFSLVNNYGPAEATVVATSCLVDPADPQLPSVPSIGRPIDGVRIHVVDERLRPVSDGVIGELLIGGESLARGYLGDPDLSAQRFIPDPFPGGTGGRLYRTGDLVRCTDDGELEFVGRSDEQVKIRGQRVELGEISVSLSRHPAVCRNAVISVGDRAGQTRLVACVVAAERSAQDTEAVRAYLRESLPEHMIPGEFIWMDALPLSTSDKVDRAALAAQVASMRASAGAGDAPDSDLETTLVTMVSELLAVDTVGVHDNFFLLGGHSLLAAQLIARIDERFGVDLPLRDLFDSPTVAEVAAAVEALMVADLDTLSEEEAERLADHIIGYEPSERRH